MAQAVKNLPEILAGDPGSIPGPGRSPREGNGNPLQYSCLENSTDRGTWQATVHGVTQSHTCLSMHTRKLNCTVESSARDVLEDSKSLGSPRGLEGWGAAG